MIKVLPPRTAEEVVARERERKARTTLLMALLEDHLAKFHKMVDAKEMWEAIKSRFGGNDESKKMQKYLLNFSLNKDLAANNKGARVLSVCCEIMLMTFCSLNNANLDNVISQTLFADGAGAVIVGSDSDLTNEVLF
nr:putative chalcone synthase [Tanacetum cinerariifolium]